MSHQHCSVADRVVTEVADLAGVDPLDLPVLFDRVDPDALNMLVDGLDDGEVEFDYAGYEVVVDSAGTVDVERASTSDNRSDVQVQ